MFLVPFNQKSPVVESIDSKLIFSPPVNWSIVNDYIRTQ